MSKVKQKIYLETSVISAYFDFKEQNLSRKNETRIFWDYNLNEYDIYISDLVIIELSNTPKEENKKILLGLIKDIPRLPFDEKVIRFGKKYLEAGLIPISKKPDAYHFAIATLNQIEILVSWNYDHIANLKKEQRVNAINKLHNYPEVRTEFPSKLIINFS